MRSPKVRYNIGELSQMLLSQDSCPIHGYIQSYATYSRKLQRYLIVENASLAKVLHFVNKADVWEIGIRELATFSGIITNVYVLAN
jgi:hypothetical protein